MPDHEQERFEDYLEVEHYLESLRAERKGVLPQNLTAEQAAVYHMASLLRSATPEHTEPRAAFLEELHRTLQNITHEQENSLDRSLPLRNAQIRHQGKAQVSRRHLLTGGAVAAASLALGTAAGVGFEKHQEAPSTPATDWKMPLVGAGVATTWLPILKLADLGRDAFSFQTETIVGYVMRNDEHETNNDEHETNSEAGIIALSASCTHMGCLVQWHGKERTFNCPCHDGKFDEYGQPAKQSAVRYLRALPRLKTRISEDGYIYVEVPEKTTNL